MRALALDFDGVISDSAAEAFAVGLVTYQSLCPVEGWEALAERAREMTRTELLAEPLYQAFVEGMPLGNAVRFANGAAALSVTKLGAQPSAPTRSEIESFLSESKE